MNRTVKPATLVALVAGALAACGPLEPARPNVVLILIDSLRADHVGSYGYPLDTTPRIDGLASESLRFESAHAQSPWTKPSIPTLFTSLYPIQHRVYEGEAHGSGGALESDLLSGDLITLAETFQAAGYHTVAWVNNAHLPPEQGFAQGFDVYEHGRFSAAEINGFFRAFLDERPEQPFFAYLHYLDAHWPFQPDPLFRDRFSPAPRPSVFDRESWRGLRDQINDGSVALSPDDQGQLVARHDGSLAQLDHHVGEAVDELARRGLLENTAVLLTSDHGEELMDHGRVGHGGTLYKELIEIPLILRLPGARRRGVVDTPARLLDVYPTLVSLANIEAPEGLEGRDLLAETVAAPLVAETRHGQSYRISIRRANWKLIRSYAVPPVARVVRTLTEPGFHPGMRLKLRARIEPDGELVASKVSVRPPIDDDIELTGPIEAVDAARHRVRVLGIDIDARQLVDAEGISALGAFTPGGWVKIEGEMKNGRFAADAAKVVAAGNRAVIEGPVSAAEDLGNARTRLSIGPLQLSVDPGTRRRGFDGPIEIVVAPPPPPRDPFAATRLLSGEGLETKDALFDLSSDPGESLDLAASEPERLARLQADLSDWLDRIRPTAGRVAERAVLDAKTIEQLVELGYLE